LTLKNLAAWILLPLSCGLLLFAWKWQMPDPRLPDLPPEPRPLVVQSQGLQSQAPFMSLVAAKAKKDLSSSSAMQTVQLPPPAFNLRGIALVEGRGLALIETLGGQSPSRWLKAGDKLPDAGRIDEIRADRILYTSPDGSRKELRLPQRNPPR
jgi:hypothetical protein